MEQYWHDQGIRPNPERVQTVPKVPAEDQRYSEILSPGGIFVCTVEFFWNTGQENFWQAQQVYDCLSCRKRTVEKYEIKHGIIIINKPHNESESIY